MDSLLPLVVIAVIAAAVVLLLVRRTQTKGDSLYQLRPFLLSKAERSFYGVLVQAVGDSGLVFAKVRIADVLATAKGLDNSARQTAQNKINSKHFDFLVCDPDDCSVRIAVELDDKSHDSAKARDRDKLVNGACDAAGLPLLRVKAAQAYVVGDIRQQVLQHLQVRPVTAGDAMPAAANVRGSGEQDRKGPLSGAAQATAAPTLASKPASDSAAAKPAAIDEPVCPKCGAQMLMRKARSGKNAGQQFWGCSTYPKCRGVVQPASQASQ